MKSPQPAAALCKRLVGKLRAALRHASCVLVNEASRRALPVASCVGSRYVRCLVLRIALRFASTHHNQVYVHIIDTWKVRINSCICPYNQNLECGNRLITYTIDLITNSELLQLSTCLSCNHHDQATSIPNPQNNSGTVPQPIGHCLVYLIILSRRWFRD